MIIKKANSTDPNKIKKCDCEDKNGPKPFDYKNNKNVSKPKSN